MSRTIRTIIGIVFIGIIMFCAISIAQNIGKRWRADITEQKLYTLSDGTKAILAKLRQPITMRLYFAKTASMKGPDQIRFFNNYYQFVKALLEEYEMQSNGMVKLEIIDPRPYSDEEMQAMQYGLKRFQITEEESFFFGLVLQTEFGVTKSIPFFAPDRQNFVEYDISYLIDTAITRQKRRIGILSSLPVFGEDVTGYMAQMMRMQGQQPKPAWNFVTQLKQKYDVKKIEADTDKIEDIDVLLIIHPKDLPDKTLFAIDQYVLKGGRAIVLVDPHCVAEQAGQKQNPYQAPPSTASDMNKLLRMWHVEMPKNTFAGDRTLALKASLNPNQRPQTIIGFMNLVSSSAGGGVSSCFNPNSTITADLNQVRVLFPGVLREVTPKAADEDKAKDEKAEDAQATPTSGEVKVEEKADEKKAAEEKITLTPLISTTARGNTWKVDNPYELMMLDPQRLMQKFIDGTEPVHMGYLITGRFQSAFPNGIDITEEKKDEDSKGDKKKDEAQAPKTHHVTGLTEASEECVVAVYSDVDFISDIVAYQNTIFGSAMMVGDNASLMLNTIDDLTGSVDLISIRSRGSYQRPFTRVDAIEAAAEKESEAEINEYKTAISGFESELQKLVSQSSGGDTMIVGSDILQKKKELEDKKQQAQIKLREAQKRKRQRIESLGNRLNNLNTLVIPAVILIVAMVLGIYRSVRRRHYISHASDS